VGVEDKDHRIDLVNQLTYFLPHMLALSASSPFWQGMDTGLNSYRLTVFDNLPRTGMPPQFDSWGEYQRSVDLLVNLGMIEDSSKIWWDLRPSARFPTIESRICDVSPLLENTLSLAAVTQCLTRMLRRLAHNNQRWRIYDNFLISENRWRAQRYGISEGLIDFGAREVKPISHLLIELFDLLDEDMDTLKCRAEVEAAANILGTGTSADRQRATYHAAIANGDSEEVALKAVVDLLINEFHADL
jgi:carboxylate-amine ligase